MNYVPASKPASARPATRRIIFATITGAVLTAFLEWNPPVNQSTTRIVPAYQMPLLDESVWPIWQRGSTSKAIGDTVGRYKSPPTAFQFGHDTAPRMAYSPMMLLQKSAKRPVCLPKA
ncbi:uncharacterized protein LOC142775897 isoform X2 [Rhipicephalus microplus]|uniref:uncharacterized protein LOC142775897 isoform X2 n=1 Tax=Rhipicephalus microplus TaxID=6941 RepID=UPI003F6A6EE1